MPVKLGVLALLEAKPGKGDELGAFLESGRALAAAEEGTVTWYAFGITGHDLRHLRHVRDGGGAAGPPRGRDPRGPRQGRGRPARARPRHPPARRPRGRVGRQRARQAAAVSSSAG